MSELAKTTEKPRDIKGLINSDAVKQQIARALPTHMTPDRFLRVATTALLKNPKLAGCTQESFVKSMLDCSSVGLEPDGRLAHLIPYGSECQLIIDYKGLIQLSKRSGEVATWSPHVIYENDSYSFEDFVFRHKADPFSDRGEPVGAVSAVKTRNGDLDFEIMSKAQILAVRDSSQGYQYAVKKGYDNPWISSELEMWRKTVMRRHSKRLTLSPEFNDALKFEDDLPPIVRNVTPRQEALTTASNPFDANPKPLTLEELMERDNVTEADLMAILADAGVCKPDAVELDADQVAHTVENWDALMGGKS